MSMTSGLRAQVRGHPRVQNAVTVETLSAAGYPSSIQDTTADGARKLSAVDRCLEILSDSMAKLPNYVMDTTTRERKADHYLLHVLNIRPNEAMSPAVRKKVLELSRLETGNGYDWILRNQRTGRVEELIPIPGSLVRPWLDSSGRVWYTVFHPLTREPMVLPATDICHYKAASRDGIKGISVLSRASEVIAAGRAAQQYDRSYYENGGQPGGILRTESDVGGYVKGPDGKPLVDVDGHNVTKKEFLRGEWERIHAGPKNSHRVAILDNGLDYKPLAATNKEAQFVESREVSIKDLARYFGVPLYKLQEGKQAYGSNEQNAIEYVVGTLHPIVSQYEEEQTWKLLTDSELKAGLEVRINMMAELKGDTASRASWYRAMREASAFSPNDIRALEDLPDIEGGDDYSARLDSVPLRSWARLSEQRNEGSNGNAGNS